MNNTNTTSSKKVTFTDAKPGDKVWSITEGWGVVKERSLPHNQYPLAVQFENGAHITYTLWGRRSISDLIPTLFWVEVKIDIPEKPMPALEVDAKVLVWLDDSKSKYCRHFSHFENNKIYAFDKGLSSWTGNYTSPWDHWELAE